MIDQDVLFPPGATARDWANDALLAGSLSIAAIISSAVMGFLTSPQTLLLMLVQLAMTLPLAFRRHTPLLTMAMCAVAGFMQVMTVNVPTLSLAAVPVVAYSVARWVPGSVARVVLVVGTLGAIVGPMRWFNVQYPAGITAYILYWGACMGAVIAPYAIGRRFRELFEARELQARAAEERYQLLLAEREQQNRLTEASTRAMIARELHDIVAHSLSVMVVQAEGARAASDKKPELAQEALTTIADTGREALTEMRRIVGVLRAGPESGAAYSPAPRLGDLPDLVQRATDRADLTVQGEPYPVAPGVELTAYRVVQEALTNFLKHAGPDARAHVTLAYEPYRLVADIVDDGTAVPAGDGAGTGLRGMYERVSSMGGTLRAGVLESGGFRVTAILPCREAGSPREPQDLRWTVTAPNPAPQPPQPPQPGGNR